MSSGRVNSREWIVSYSRPVCDVCGVVFGVCRAFAAMYNYATLVCWSQSAVAVGQDDLGVVWLASGIKAGHRMQHVVTVLTGYRPPALPH